MVFERNPAVGQRSCDNVTLGGIGLFGHYAGKMRMIEPHTGGEHVLIELFG